MAELFINARIYSAISYFHTIASAVLPTWSVLPSHL